jgi:hypothetical protein
MKSHILNGEMARKPAPITLAPIKRVKPKRKSPTYTPEQEAIRSERLRKLNADPEFKKKRIKAYTEAHKKLWQDPEYREIALKNFRDSKMRRGARLRLYLAERYEDPAEREKMRQQMLKRHAEGKMKRKGKVSAQGMANRIAANRRMQDKRRGFTIPFHLRSKYRDLTRNKHKTAREAGIILGLISENGKPLLQKKAA